MPRLSPQELQNARRAKREEKELVARRRQEEEELMARRRQEERENAEQQKARLEQLSSVIKALYEEMDKLNKKSPGMTLSELSLDRVNKAINAVKTLLQDEGDEFIDEISEFISAGDMPEYRDVVLVLSQLRAGLDRFHATHSGSWRSLGIGSL